MAQKGGGHNLRAQWGLGLFTHVYNEILWGFSIYKIFYDMEKERMWNIYKLFNLKSI